MPSPLLVIARWVIHSRGDSKRAAKQLSDCQAAAAELLPVIQGTPQLRQGAFSGAMEVCSWVIVIAPFLISLCVNVFVHCILDAHDDVAQSISPLHVLPCVTRPYRCMPRFVSCVSYSNLLVGILSLTCDDVVIWLHNSLENMLVFFLSKLSEACVGDLA